MYYKKENMEKDDSVVDDLSRVIMYCSLKYGFSMEQMSCP